MRRFKALWPFFSLAVLALLYFTARLAVSSLYPFEYRAMVYDSAAGNGLDPYLVAAVVNAESGWDPDATSRQGARGLMQIMPDTGSWAADQTGLQGYQPNMLYDPGINLRLGCWYLASLRRQFDGSDLLALAAYNGGGENVRRWLAERRWGGEPGATMSIPFPETREYVRRVSRDAAWYRRFYDQRSWLARLLWPGGR